MLTKIFTGDILDLKRIRHIGPPSFTPEGYVKFIIDGKGSSYACYAYPTEITQDNVFYYLEEETEGFPDLLVNLRMKEQIKRNLEILRGSVNFQKTANSLKFLQDALCVALTQISIDNLMVEANTAQSE